MTFNTGLLRVSFVGMLSLLLVCGMSELVQAQSVVATPNALSQTINRTDIVSGIAPATLPEISLTGTTTLNIVQTAPWSINVTVSVVTPAGASSALTALGVEKRASPPGFVFPNATTALFICDNTTACTNIGFRLNLDTIDNGSTNGSYTFTVRFSLTDAGGGSGTEQAFTNFTFTVTLGDIVAIGTQVTSGASTSITRAAFSNRFFTLGTYSIALVAVTDYAVTGSVSFTGSGSASILSPDATLQVKITSFTNSDDGALTINNTINGVFGNLSSASSTFFWSGPNTEFGVNTLTASVSTQLDLDALGNASTLNNSLVATITMVITEN